MSIERFKKAVAKLKKANELLERWDKLDRFAVLCNQYWSRTLTIKLEGFGEIFALEPEFRADVMQQMRRQQQRIVLELEAMNLVWPDLVPTKAKEGDHGEANGEGPAIKTGG